LKKLLAVPLALGALGLGLVACGDDEADAFCDKAAEVEDAGSGLGDLGEQDIEAAKEALGEANTRVQEAADVAPNEISGDVDEVASFINDLNGQLEGANSPQDLLGLADGLQGRVAELQEASDNIDAYIEDNC
jgi:hypothetical protein